MDLPTPREMYNYRLKKKCEARKIHRSHSMSAYSRGSDLAWGSKEASLRKLRSQGRIRLNQEKTCRVGRSSTVKPKMQLGKVELRRVTEGSVSAQNREESSHGKGGRRWEPDHEGLSKHHHRFRLYSKENGRGYIVVAGDLIDHICIFRVFFCWSIEKRKANARKRI